MDSRNQCKPRRRLLFADLASPTEIQQVLADAEELRYRRDSVIFQEGDHSKHLYVIMEGSVEFTLRDSKGVLDVQFPGEYFGELGLFDSHPRSATATATADTVCRVIAQETLLAWLDAHPTIAVSLCRHLTQRIRDLSAERAPGYRRLVDYIERNAVAEGDVRVIREMPSITHLAPLLDMTREHASNILRELKKRRCITLEDRTLTVWKPLPKTF